MNLDKKDFEKKIKFKFVCILVIIFGAGLLSGQTIDVMTYNIRYDTPKDCEDVWDKRKDFLLSQIIYFEPGIFGTQEAMNHQAVWLDEKLESYSFVGLGRDKDSTGEHVALFYDRSKFNLIKNSTFWLSETPEKPSIGWDASLHRICTYALFEDIVEGNKFWVFNLHLGGVVAIIKSVDLVLEKIEKLNSENYPVILMGDFNITSKESPIIKILKTFNDSKLVSIQRPFGPDATGHGFDVTFPDSDRIDFIFTSKENIVVNKYAVISSVENMKYPSDHSPVLCRLTILNK